MLTDVLRQRLKFDGIIITDALNMAGISQFFTPAQAVIETFVAGADIALMPYEIRSLQDLIALESLVDEVVAAVKQGRLSVTELQQSAERVIQLRQQLASGSLQPICSARRLASDQALEQQLAIASLTQVGENKLPFPLPLSQLRLHLLVPEQTKYQGWLQALTFHGIHPPSVSYSTFEQDESVVLQHIRDADLVLGCLLSPNQSAVELGVLADLLALKPATLSPEQQKKQLLHYFAYAKSIGKHTLMVALRTPYDLTEFADHADLRLATYSYNQQSQDADRPLSGPAYDAVIGFLLGQFQAKGHLPVQLDP